MADAPPKSAHSHALVKAFVILVLLAFAATLAWVTVLNWRKDGHFSFRIFDTAWWRPGMASAQPVLDGALNASNKANDALWGDNGLVDQTSRWWSSKLSARDKATGTPAKPAAQPDAVPKPAQVPAVDLKRLERSLADAEIDFQLGLDHYRLAKPKENELVPETRDHLRQARGRFLSAKDMLERVIPQYESATGHDDERLADAKALQTYNERLLASLNKLLDVP